MPFEKGQSGNPKGKPKGAVSQKVEMWNQLGDYVVTQGAEPVGSTPAEFWDVLRAEHQKWERIIRERGIQGE
jgi:tripartite-type tricarboxylate transporter receptor subunit TctC